MSSSGRSCPHASHRHPLAAAERIFSQQHMPYMRWSCSMALATRRWHPAHCTRPLMYPGSKYGDRSTARAASSGVNLASSPVTIRAAFSSVVHWLLKVPRVQVQRSLAQFR